MTVVVGAADDLGGRVAGVGGAVSRVKRALGADRRRRRRFIKHRCA